MLERRVSLLCLLLGPFFSCLIASVSALGSLASSKISSVANVNVRPDYQDSDSIPIWPAQLRPSAVTEIRIASGRQEALGGDGTTLPPATPTYSSKATHTLHSPPGPTITGRASLLNRRTLVDNSNAIMISSLSSALASATASALSMSQSMAEQFSFSVEELKVSAEALASSASSAIAAASSAVLAAEESAAQAIFDAERSAASVVAEVTLSRTGEVPETTTTRTQTQLELEAAEGAAMSITRAAVAIVVSIIVSAVTSILGFYLFLRCRRSRKKRRQREEGREGGQEENAETRQDEPPAEQHEQHRREQERDLSATEALARAVVSYIEKEQMPTPITPVTTNSPVQPTGLLSPHLRPPPTPMTPVTPPSPVYKAGVPSPATPASPGNFLLPTRYSVPQPAEQKPPPSPVSPINSESADIGFAVGGEVDDPFWVQQNPPPNHPPPPTPLRSPSLHHRKTSSSTSGRSNRAHRRIPSTPRRLTSQTQAQPQPQTPSQPHDSDRDTYEEIIMHPLEPVVTNQSSASRPQSAAEAAERDERRDSNWPLPKTSWP
ncbi:hypothetical protein V8F20_007575 [Naviculisporaceae sp. PSN 640]